MSRQPETRSGHLSSPQQDEEQAHVRSPLEAGQAETLPPKTGDVLDDATRDIPTGSTPDAAGSQATVDWADVAVDNSTSVNGLGQAANGNLPIDEHDQPMTESETRVLGPTADTSSPAARLRDSDETVTHQPDDAGSDSTKNASHTVSRQTRRFGDYEILDEIARGGMGVVFRARQVSLQRIVALKMILSGQLAGPSDIQRFRTEAQAAANLDHPGIVPIYEVGDLNGQHYYSMAFVEGESLADRVKRGPLPAREAVEYTKKIADAIAMAHQRGIIHRDLKPGNVLIDASGQPKVTDFGLAKHTKSDDGVTATGQVLGTPAFMPPEQASGDLAAVGPQSDVYSLGAILYCLLTGRPPFQAANVLDTLFLVREQQPAPPRMLNPKIPRDAEIICLKCLAKERFRRYASAAALAEDLQRHFDDRPILARPPSLWERAVRWARQHVIAATTLSLLPLAILLTLPTVLQVLSIDDDLESDWAVITHMNELLEQAPENAAAYHDRANAYFKLGQFEKAAADLESSLQLDDSKWYVHQLAGMVRMKQGDYRNAINDFSAALRRNPVSADSFFQRAVCRYRLRDFDESRSDLDEALRLRPSFTEALQLRDQLDSSGTTLEN